MVNFESLTHIFKKLNTIDESAHRPSRPVQNRHVDLAPRALFNSSDLGTISRYQDLTQVSRL